ncbi:GNAT family N-acetyltransferase [Streptomyces sp. NBC_01317]|uniref:GNAT family N-acetyltransferase n=1 Tax=Streptomyces sp. NBC_01317 TaxID=2903822 RepID=UPI002E153797|nr:GNAT family N-acetyltransferase [Streptomyces sp. NBC_01317]
MPIKTLGPLKPPAYYKAADDGGLLVAIEAEQVIGYALFGLSIRSAHIRLAHLYVAEEQRGRSVARWLVGEIKEWYPQRLGIKAKCRCRSRHGRENVLAGCRRAARMRLFPRRRTFVPFRVRWMRRRVDHPAVSGLTASPRASEVRERCPASGAHGVRDVCCGPGPLGRAMADVG